MNDLQRDIKNAWIEAFIVETDCEYAWAVFKYEQAIRLHGFVVLSVK